MPFPLAHPAAVLPLRRFKGLNFSALVVGTLVPDIGYAFREGSGLSHQALGSILFGLPVGVLILTAFYAFRTSLVVRMPEGVRRSLLPLCRRAPGPVWILVLSLVIGIWTHVLWDSVTHPDGWLVEHIPVLFLPVFHFDGRTARVCTALWYGSSFVAVGCLFIAFEKWRQNVITTVGGKVGTGNRIVQDAIVVAILVIPISLAHHLIRNPLGSILAAGFFLSLGILFIWKRLLPRANTILI
jgi:hypothetical protein